MGCPPPVLGAGLPQGEDYRGINDGYVRRHCRLRHHSSGAILMSIYLWKCTECHHEWQATVNAGAICEWCGEDGFVLQDEGPLLPSSEWKRMTGGGKEI